MDLDPEEEERQGEGGSLLDLAIIRFELVSSEHLHKFSARQYHPRPRLRAVVGLRDLLAFLPGLGGNCTSLLFTFDFLWSLIVEWFLVLFPVFFGWHFWLDCFYKDKQQVDGFCRNECADSEHRTRQLFSKIFI